MRDEMGEHLDRATARLVARGYPAADARHEAMREFGNVTSLQEHARVARGGRWLDALAADSRFAVRQFARRPGVTLAMLVVLAAGMSISTSLFSLLQAFSGQPPLGVPHQDDVVRIRGSQVTDGLVVRRFSLEELREYQALTSHFSAVAGWANIGTTIEVEGSDGSGVHTATATFVTDNYFRVLGIRPVIGSDLPREDSSDPGQVVAVIGHGAWEQLFGRSPAAIGATLIVDGVPVTVIGVAPPKFAGLNVFSDRKLYLPLSARRVVAPLLRPDAEVFGAAARLQPGVTHQAATAAAQVVAARVAVPVDRTSGQADRRAASVDVVPLLATNGDPQIEQDRRMLAAVFTALGLLVLLVTSTNVSALQTGLAMHRRREIAIRLSMGAARMRIVRQLLTESVLLATIAAVAALGLVWAIQRVVISRVPDMPIEVVMSGPAIAFTFGIALAAGILFGLSPALHATRLTVASVLKDSTAAIATRRAWLQRGLVVAQIALTQPLIVGLAVMLFTLSSEFQRLGLTDSGEQIVALRLRPSAAMAAQEQDSLTLLAQQRAEMLRLRERLTAMPGVDGAVPFLQATLALEGYVVHPDDRITGGIEGPLRITAPIVAPGYFGVMGIPIVLGRDFAPTELSVPPEAARTRIPVVIGAHLARELWPGASPIGRRLEPAPDATRPGHAFSVVGVVDQPSDEKRDVTDGYRVYLPPDSASLATSLALLVRSTGDAPSLIRTIRTLVREELPRLTVSDVRTIADMEAEVRHGFTVIAFVLGGAGLATLMLAAIGLYAVVAFAVGQRTSEIAVRMAVGAHARQIVGRFIGDGLRLGAIGLFVGLPLSLIVLRMLLTADVLPSVPFVPVAAIAALGVLVVALTGTWIPARRAAAVDPASILRQD